MPEKTDIEEAGAVVHPIGTAKKKGSGGGPTSDAGKRVSVSERDTPRSAVSPPRSSGMNGREDLDLLCAGFRTSVQPKTPLEVYLADKLAHISWRLMRLERASTGVIQSQIDAAAARSRETIELESDALPEDELVWREYDAASVRDVLMSLASGDEQTIDPVTATGALLAISIAGGRLDTPVGGADPASPSPLSGASVTAAQLRSHLLQGDPKHRPAPRLRHRGSSCRGRRCSASPGKKRAGQSHRARAKNGSGLCSQ